MGGAIVLSFITYDVTKKALFGRNMLDCTKTSRKTWDTTVETTVKFDYKLNVEPFATTELYNYQVVSV